MKTKLKLGAQMDVLDPDKFFACICEQDERGELVNAIPLAYLTLQECAKARDAISILNMLRGTP